MEDTELIKEIDSLGVITYIDPTTRLLHRDNDLPAIIHPDGTKFWYKNGNIHRENGPAYISSYRGKEEYYGYYQNGKLHNLNGPAQIWFIDANNTYNVPSQYYINNDLLTEEEFYKHPKCLVKKPMKEENMATVFYTENNTQQTNSTNSYIYDNNISYNGFIGYGSSANTDTIATGNSSYGTTTTSYGGGMGGAYSTQTYPYYTTTTGGSATTTTIPYTYYQVPLTYTYPYTYYPAQFIYPYTYPTTYEVPQFYDYKQDLTKLLSDQIRLEADKQIIDELLENIKKKTEEKKEEKEQISLLSQKTELQKAVYRTITDQSVSLIKSSISKLLTDKYDNKKIKQFSDMLNSEIGDILVRLILGLSLSQVNIENEHMLIFLEELRISGLTHTGNAIMKSIMETIQTMIPKEKISNIRIEKEEIFMEEEKLLIEEENNKKKNE